MRKAPLSIAVVVAALALVIWYVGKSDGSEDIEPVEAAAVEPPASAVLEDDVAEELESPAAAEPDRNEAVEAPDETDASASTYPRSRVFGVVTDESGRALAGIRVTMNSHGRWTSEDVYPDEIPGFDTETDALGAFEFDTPLPTSDWVSLDIHPTDFHVRAGRDFGPAGGRDEDPVREGDNDMGTFVLQSAGAFEGIVLDAHGQPIEGARVRLDGSFPGGYSVGSKCDETGHYLVGGAPGGTYNVEALARGYVTVKKSSIEVRNNDVTAGVDFMLERAPSIAGRVIDEEGNPLEEARLWGWPKGSGQGAGTRSKADGSFVIFLPQDEPYRLEAELAGFEKFEAGFQEHFEPGTDDIEIVLKKLDLMTYRIRNAVTGAPIERFGLKVIQVRTENGTRSSSVHREPAKLRDHPDGEVRMRGHVRFDDYTIVAPGYGPQRGDVAVDEEAERVQTIRMTPAGRVTGRFVKDGTSLGRSTIRIQGDRVPLRPGVTEGEDDIFSDDWGMDIDVFAGEKRQHRTERDGTFEIGELAAGTYQLTFTAAGVAPKVVERVVVKAGETTPLGDVQAFAPGEIHGTLVFSGGRSVSGLTVMLGNTSFGDDESAQVTDLTGRFVFKDLGEGSHYVWIEEKQGVLLRGEPIEVVLSVAEIREVQIDLSDRIPSRLKVEVRVNGEPLDGGRVKLVPSQEGSRTLQLGYTSETGVAEGDVAAFEDATLEVLGPTGLFIGTHGPVTLRSGDSEHVQVDLEASRLTVSMPAVHAELEAGTDFQVFRIHRTDLEGSRWRSARPETAWTRVGDELRIDLGWIQPGTYEVKLQLASLALLGAVEVTASGPALCRLTE